MTYEIIKAGWGGYRVAVRNEHGALTGEGFVQTRAEANRWIAHDKQRERSKRIKNRLKDCPWVRS